MFHAKQLVIDRVFVQNMGNCGYAVEDCRHHGHEMGDRESRVESGSPYFPFRAVARQHVTASSYDREGFPALFPHVSS